jgi:hypothetical protein
MVGYLVANAKGDAVTELVGENEEVGVEMARCWAVRGDQGTNLDLNPAAAGLVRRLGKVCEGVSVRASGNWQIFAWEEVLGALMALRRGMVPLPAGRVVVGIEGYGRLALEVEGGKNQRGAHRRSAGSGRRCATDDAPALRPLATLAGSGVVGRGCPARSVVPPSLVLGQAGRGLDSSPGRQPTPRPVPKLIPGLR